MDNQDDDTVPLLEDEAGHTVDLNLSINWLGPWNTGEGNPFLDEEWKPLNDPLSEGEQCWNNFVGTGYLLKTPIISHLFLKYKNFLIYLNKERRHKSNPHRGTRLRTHTPG